MNEGTTDRREPLRFANSKDVLTWLDTCNPDQSHKLVYISHPISGDVAYNVARVRAIQKKIRQIDKSVIPLAPYLDLIEAMGEDAATRKLGLAAQLKLISKGYLYEVWGFGNSEGCAMEYATAKLFGIPVFDQRESSYDDVVVDRSAL